METTEKRWFIYVLRDPRDLKIRYCGWTDKPNRRLNHHIYRSPAEHNHKASWIVSLSNLGLKPILEVVETGTTPKGQEEAERRWIKKLREEGEDLTNLTDGGEGCWGLKHSPESIERSAVAHRGKVYPPEVRAKISAAGKGRKQSVETKAKRVAYYTPEKRAEFSAVSKGRPKSEVTKGKMSLAATKWQTGRKLPLSTRQKLSEAQKRRYAKE